MERRGTVLTLVVVCVFALADSRAWAEYGGGQGTADDPYLIYTAEDMATFAATRKDQSKHFRLMDDVDLGAYTGTEYPSLGINWGRQFTGVFDGNDRTISNFTYMCADVNCVGLFGNVGEDGRIENLGLIDPNIMAIGCAYVGALAGECRGTIVDCYVVDANVSGMFRVGGLAGSCWSLSNCHVDGNVTGDDEVGGLAGCVWDIVTCCSARAKTVGRQDVGGLTGVNDGWLNCSSNWEGAFRPGSSPESPTSAASRAITKWRWAIPTHSVASTDTST